MTVEVTFRGTTGIGTVTATVDTGATNTTIGRRLAERIGIVAVDSQEVVLANGKSDIVGVGSADIEI